VGKDVINIVLNILNNGVCPTTLNKTFIALVPKVKSPNSPMDYRPISLCNVLYKLVSKVITNRLKDILHEVVHENQSAFVPGRLITNNILIAFEHFQFMRKKNKGKRGFMALKLDMSKAYDRIEWVFLQSILLRLGFDEKWVSLVMRCVTTVSYAALVNGQPTEWFKPHRGLRQGDPISPYLFLLCAEGLSSLILDSVNKKKLHGMQIAKGAPCISHLFFADDSLIFARANVTEAQHILEVLHLYEQGSGQIVNLDKCEVSFSRNVGEQSRNILQRSLGFKAVETHNRYLGLPTFIGRSKKAIFQGIRDRVWRKLKGWKDRTLSKAGKRSTLESRGSSHSHLCDTMFRASQVFL